MREANAREITTDKTIDLIDVLLPTPTFGVTLGGDPLNNSERMALIDLVSIGIKCMRGETPPRRAPFNWVLQDDGIVRAICYKSDVVVGFIVLRKPASEEYLVCARSLQTEISFESNATSTKPAHTTRLHYPTVVFTDIGRAMKAVEQVYRGEKQFDEAAWIDWK